MLLSWAYFSYQNKDLVCFDRLCLLVNTNFASNFYHRMMQTDTSDDKVNPGLTLSSDVSVCIIR